MKMQRFGGILLAAAILFGAAAAVPVRAAGPAVYDLNASAPFQTRTKAAVAAQYAAAHSAGGSYRDDAPSSWYDEPASTASPYAAGRLTADTQTAMLAMLNYQRWLVGAAPVLTPSVHSAELQAGALIRNFSFAHSVDPARKPADMDQTLWDLGAAADHNVLAYGYSPRGAITGWLNEGYSRNAERWDASYLGHRSAMLSWSISSLQLGYAGSVAIGLEAAHENTQPPLPALPYPGAGNVPLNDVGTAYSAWSVQLNLQVFQRVTPANIGGITVRVTDLSDGASYDCTEANGKLIYGADMLGFAQPAAAGSRYADGSAFRVEILGLAEASSGNPAELTYTTNFFDVAQIADTRVTGVTAPGGWTRLNGTADAFSAENLPKIAAVLPDTMAVQTESGRTATVSIAEKWTYDAAGGFFRSSADLSTLPAGVADPDGVLRTLKLYPQTVAYAGAFGASAAAPKEGTAGSFSLWRYMLGTPHQTVYQVTAQNGGCTAVRRFDETSQNRRVADDGTIVWDVASFRTEDSGTWIGLYSGDSGSDAWIAGIGELSVTGAHEFHILDDFSLTGTTTDRILEIWRTGDTGEKLAQRTISGAGLYTRPLQMTFDGTLLTDADVENVTWSVQNIAGFESYAPAVTMTNGLRTATGAKSGVARVTASYTKDGRVYTDWIDIVVPGDVDRSGTVNNGDSNRVARYVASQDPAVKISYLVPRTMTAADAYVSFLAEMNADNPINAGDTNVLKLMVSAKINPKN